MPDSFGALAWVVASFLVGVASWLIGRVYDNLKEQIRENREEIKALSARVDNIEDSIDDKLNWLVNKLGRG